MAFDEHKSTPLHWHTSINGGAQTDDLLAYRINNVRVYTYSMTVFRAPAATMSGWARPGEGATNRIAGHERCVTGGGRW